MSRPWPLALPSRPSHRAAWACVPLTATWAAWAGCPSRIDIDFEIFFICFNRLCPRQESHQVYSMAPCREQVFFPVLSALSLLPYFSRSLIVLSVRCQKCRENPRDRRGSKLEARRILCFMCSTACKLFKVCGPCECLHCCVGRLGVLYSMRVN